MVQVLCQLIHPETYMYFVIVLSHLIKYDLMIFYDYAESCSMAIFDGQYSLQASQAANISIYVNVP